MKKYKNIIIGVVATILIATGIVFYMNKDAKSIVDNIESTSVQRGNISKSIEENGQIESSNINQYYSNGILKVAKINVDVGSQVKAGDVLMTFDSTKDLELKKLDKEIAALQASYQEALKVSDKEHIKLKELEIESLENSLNLAVSNLADQKKLYEEGIIAQTEFQNYENSVEQLKIQLKMLNTQYIGLKDGTSQNIKNQYISQIESLKVSKEIIEKSKSDDIIKASMDGVVTEMNVYKGDTPLMGTLMLEVQDSENLIAIADFLVDDAIQINKDMKVNIENEDIGLYLDNLSIKNISPKARSTMSELGVEQKRVRVEVELPKDAADLLIGANVDVIVNIDNRDDVLYIPTEGTFKRDGKDFVAVIEDNKIVEKEIEIGMENDDYIEVISGLSEGEIISLD